MTLRKGSVVELVAPSSKCTEEEYEKSVQYIEALGLVPRVPLYKELVDETSLYAHTDEMRYQHLANAIMATDSELIWCLQGGHGSSRLFEKLALLKPTRDKKYVGFSDVTAIEMLLWKQWGWPSVYGPNLVQVVSDKVDEEARRYTEALLFEDKAHTVSEWSAYNTIAKKEETYTGKILGGCLSLIQSMLDTSYMPKLDKNTMLLLEDDRFESPERIDRMLGHIKNSGVCDHVKVVLLGNFLEQPEHVIESKEKEKLENVLKEFGAYLDKKGVPLVQHSRVGHAYRMIPLVLGKESELIVGKDLIKLIN